MHPPRVLKTFMQDGRWIERPGRTPILICVCGERYIKTRATQKTCFRCMSDEASVKKGR